jgi:hypothetical protein
MLWFVRTKLLSPAEAFMIIVGCDFHPSWQQAAIFDASTGEIVERKPSTTTVRRKGLTAVCRYRR